MWPFLNFYVAHVRYPHGKIYPPTLQKIYRPTLSLGEKSLLSCLLMIPYDSWKNDPVVKPAETSQLWPLTEIPWHHHRSTPAWNRQVWGWFSHLPYKGAWNPKTSHPWKIAVFCTYNLQISSIFQSCFRSFLRLVSYKWECFVIKHWPLSWHYNDKKGPKKQSQES